MVVTRPSAGLEGLRQVGQDVVHVGGNRDRMLPLAHTRFRYAIYTMSLPNDL